MPFDRTLRGLLTGKSRLQLLKLAAQLPTYVKLLWGLLKDPRVPAPGKALLAAALAYLISPIDLIPDFIPVIGQIDDMVVFMTVWKAFRSMCPEAIWEEHLRLVKTGESDFDRDFAWLKKHASGLVDYVDRNQERILRKYGKKLEGEGQKRLR